METTIMENQMEKKMDNEMETGIIRTRVGQERRSPLWYSGSRLVQVNHLPSSYL